MAYLSKVQCDSCHLIADAPKDGGFPFEWIEINFKPSLRGNVEVNKRKRYHICDRCSKKMMESLGIKR